MLSSIMLRQSKSRNKKKGSTNGMAETLRIQRKQFDLDSKEDVTLIKEVTFEPVTSNAEALARVGNDAKQFLEIVNQGLKDWTREQSANDSTPWFIEDEDGEKTVYSGTSISEEKSKQLALNVLNMAKMLFGYSKQMSREQKKAAKEKAQSMLLSNPVVVESLKSGEGTAVGK
jgi:hypothetical protein